MARKIDSEVLEDMERKLGFIAAIFKKGYSEDKIFVKDLIGEIRRLKGEIDVLRSEIFEMRKSVMGGEDAGAKQEDEL